MLVEVFGAATAVFIGTQVGGFVKAKKASEVNATLTDDVLYETVREEAAAYGINVQFTDQPIIPHAIAYYDVAKSAIFWCSDSETVRTQADYFGSKYDDFIRIVLAHEAGHMNTPNVARRMESLNRFFITQAHVDLEKAAWKHGRDFIKQHGLGLRLKYELFNQINCNTYKSRILI